MDLILLLIAFFITLAAQGYITSSYNKYKKVLSKKNISGFEVARMILDSHGLENIYVTETNGILQDHYDPTRKTIKLSNDIFHGTSIDAVTGILSSQFWDAKMHIFGQGVYFTDQFDYAWFYAGEKYRGQFFSIPKVGKPFSVVASEIYYDNSQLEEYYPVEHNKEKEDRKVPKNGIRRAYVNDLSVMNF